MQRPSYPQKPFEPRKPNRQTYVLEGAQKEKVIYRDVQVNGDNDSFNLKEYFEEQGEELPPEPTISCFYQKLSLQDIINLLPPNTDLSNVIFDIDMPRYLQYTDISFTLYKRDLKFEENQYQKALDYYEYSLKKYEEDLIKYEEDLNKYNEFIKQEEIAKLEEKLKELKNEKTKT